MARETARLTVAVALTPRRASPSAATLRRLLNRALLVSIAVAAFCPLPAFAQGGGEAPPGGTQTPPPVAPELRVEAPGGKPLIREGQTNRQLLGGTWYFRQDDAFVGESERWFDQDDLTGWSAITVPHNWNATDTTENRPSVGWYRKEFTLPRSPKKALHFWKVRFEGANYRTKVWLNGRGARLLHRLLPLRGAAEEPAQGTQHARGRGLLAAQQHRPHALAAGRLQRLRHGWLVELRRDAARGLHAARGHGRRGARDRAAAAQARGRSGEGGAATRRCATSRRRTATCRSSSTSPASAS